MNEANASGTAVLTHRVLATISRHVGDHAAFSDRNYAHRWRNLSAHRPALFLHIHGGGPEDFRVFGRDAAEHRNSAAHRVKRKLSLP